MAAQVSPVEPDESSERDGFVVVWFALLIIVLLGIAAFAVDLVHAYSEEQHAQNAADAAALAGAVEIPTDTTGSNAIARANDVAQHYNFTPGQVSVTKGAVANELDVTVTKKFPTFFGSILGFSDLTVKKSAQAQYDPPASMGSAVNHLGDVPVCGDNTTSVAVGGCTDDPTPSAAIQKLWASIQGPDSDKVSGNAITTAECKAASTTQIVDGCEPGTNGANDEYDSTGETFDIKVPTANTYKLYIYDPSMVNTTPSCGAAPFSDANAGNWNTDPNPIYKSVFTNYTNTDYCPGDTFAITGTVPFATDPPMTTNYQFLDPANGAGVRSADSACPSTASFPGFGTHASTNPDPTDPAVGANAAYDYEKNFGKKSYFHQWFLMCTFAGSPTVDGNEYQLKVSSPTGLGTNQFAIMVVPSSGIPGPATSVFARKSLPLVAVNFNSGVTSNFYLARVLPSSKTRTLQLSFFDLGDNSIPGPKTGKLQVSTLGTTNGNLSCVSTPAPSNATSPRTSPAITPFPSTDFTNSGCLISYDAGSATATWNGRWVSVDITIPAATDAVNGYRCDTTQLSNCWLQLGYTPDPGGTLSDATTWDARLVGSPVRLVG